MTIAADRQGGVAKLQEAEVHWELERRPATSIYLPIHGSAGLLRTAAHSSLNLSRTNGLSRSAISSGKLRALIISCTSPRSFSRPGFVMPEASFNSIRVGR